MADTTNKPRFGTADALECSAHFLNELLDVVDLARGALWKNENQLNLALVALLGAARDSCESIIILVRHNKLRDAMVTARTTFELLVNVCFLCSKGESSAWRAIRYAMQKAFRDLHKEAHLNGFSWILRYTGTVVPSEGLKQALHEFTTKRGREKRKWTEESVESRIRVIHDKYGGLIGPTLLMTSMVIYADASEIAHGTLYANMWLTGQTNPERPPKTKEEVQTLSVQRFGMILFLIFHCFSMTTRVLAQEFPECSESKAEAAKLTDRFHSSMTFREDPSERR